MCSTVVTLLMLLDEFSQQFVSSFFPDKLSTLSISPSPILSFHIILMYQSLVVFKLPLNWTNWIFCVNYVNLVFVSFAPFDFCFNIFILLYADIALYY